MMDYATFAASVQTAFEQALTFVYLNSDQSIGFKPYVYPAQVDFGNGPRFTLNMWDHKKSLCGFAYVETFDPSTVVLIDMVNACQRLMDLAGLRRS